MVLTCTYVHGLVKVQNSLKNKKAKIFALSRKTKPFNERNFQLPCKCT